MVAALRNLPCKPRGPSPLRPAPTMPQQANLFPPEPEQAPQPSSRTGAAHPPASRQRLQAERPMRWLAHTELLVRVAVRVYVGLLILLLPWLRFWTDNALLHATAALALLSGSGVVRGIVSGLGILNIVIAIDELRASTAQARRL